jgi:hypothetical protein
VRQGAEYGFHIIVWIKAELQLADITTKTQEATVIDPRVTITMYVLPLHLTREQIGVDHRSALLRGVTG